MRLLPIFNLPQFCNKEKNAEISIFQDTHCISTKQKNRPLNNKIFYLNNAVSKINKLPDQFHPTHMDLFTGCKAGSYFWENVTNKKYCQKFLDQNLITNSIRWCYLLVKVTYIQNMALISAVTLLKILCCDLFRSLCFYLKTKWTGRVRMNFGKMLRVLQLFFVLTTNAPGSLRNIQSYVNADDGRTETGQTVQGQSL